MRPKRDVQLRNQHPAPSCVQLAPILTIDCCPTSYRTPQVAKRWEPEGCMVQRELDCLLCVNLIQKSNSGIAGDASPKSGASYHANDREWRQMHLATRTLHREYCVCWWVHVATPMFGVGPPSVRLATSVTGERSKDGSQGGGGRPPRFSRGRFFPLVTGFGICSRGL